MSKIDIFKNSNEKNFSRVHGSQKLYLENFPKVLTSTSVKISFLCNQNLLNNYTWNFQALKKFLFLAPENTENT